MKITRKYSSTPSDADAVKADMTPMLDMVFILLIFFIVTASFRLDPGVTINRPFSDRLPTTREAQDNLFQIDENDRLYHQNGLIELASVTAIAKRLKTANPDIGAHIRLDSQSSHGALIRVLDQIRLAGFKSEEIVVSDSP